MIRQSTQGNISNRAALLLGALFTIAAIIAIGGWKLTLGADEAWFPLPESLQPSVFHEPSVNHLIAMHQEPRQFLVEIPRSKQQEFRKNLDRVVLARGWVWHHSGTGNLNFVIPGQDTQIIEQMAQDPLDWTKASRDPQTAATAGPLANVSITVKTTMNVWEWFKTLTLILAAAIAMLAWTIGACLILTACLRIGMRLATGKS